jgi:signal transduction histidine kinase
MKLFNNHKHLLFFIAGSLLLLALLEGFWLQKLYSSERNDIQEKLKQTLQNDVLTLQVSIMQKNNIRLIDSFFSSREKSDKEHKQLIWGGFDPDKTDLNNFIKKSQNTFFLKLDTLSNLPIGTAKDKAIIDEFLNERRKDYRNRSVLVNVNPKSHKDTINWITTFLSEQKRAYTSLWYLYRLDYSPNLNRKLMDSFFTELKYFIHEENKIAIYPYLKNTFNIKTNEGYSFKANITKDTTFSIQSYPINISNSNPKGLINIFINSDSGTGKKASSRDSFIQLHAYEFQRFVGTFVKPEAIKSLLDYKFEGLNITFDVYRLPLSEMIPTKGNPIIATIPSGGKDGIDREKIAVAAYGFQSFIFKKIYPEILFALLVLVITALSFWLIYRNILEQKRLINLKNDFISNMTHELKTPIATVGVAIEAMNSFNALDNPTRTKEYLDISKSELNRLTLLVDKVLKMAVFEQGNPQLNIETFDIADLTQEILNSMKLQFERYNATLSFEKMGEDFSVNADKTHITSVIYNLIDNALKYGGEKPDVKITLQSPFYQFCSFSVSDNGAGIPPQYQDKIFEKFFRIPTGDVHTTKGHGLGLSYIKSVIEQHKGKINVDSEEGKGSIFSIFLPLSETV